MITKVICDTMIWYYIENGKIPINKLHDNYYATYINVKEFASTPNLSFDFKRVKRVIEVFKKYHTFLIIENPLDHILTLYNSSYQPNNNFVFEILDSFEIIIKSNLEFKINESEKGVFEKWEYKKALFPDLINAKLSELRKKRKEKISKKDYLKCSTIELTKDFITAILNGHPSSKIKFDKNLFDWNQIFFFIHMIDYYSLLSDKNLKRRKSENFLSLFV